MAYEKLNLTDKKILYELDFNSRNPVTVIAKKLKISRDVVTYRMKGFVEKGIIQKYHTIIDIAKLGYTAHKYFIRFQSITEEKEKEFIEYVKNHPDIIYSASYDGKFDSVISIWARSVENLSESLREISEKFGSFLGEGEIATIIKGEYSVRNYLIADKKYTKRYFFGSAPQPIKIDDTNKKILIELGKDARITSVEIAKKLDISADAVYQRIDKLEKSGIIQNYNIVPNEEKYPFIHYKLLVSLHNLNKNKKEQLEEYCRQHKNIWYFCTCLGPWNFEIDLDMETSEDFRNFLKELRLNFSGIIKDYTVLTAYKTHKYNFCPSMPK